MSSPPSSVRKVPGRASASASVFGLEFIYSQRGRPLLVVNNYLFRKNRGSYWRCIRCTSCRCKCRLILRAGAAPLVAEQHSHGPETEKIEFGRRVRSTMSTAEYESMVALAVAAGGGGGDGRKRAVLSAAAAAAGSDADGADGEAATAVEDEHERSVGGVLANGLTVHPDELRAVNLWVRMPHFGTDEMTIERQVVAGEQTTRSLSDPLEFMADGRQSALSDDDGDNV